MDSTMKTKLYKKIDIWKKKDDKCLIRYRCYELLGEDKFCVQNADYFYFPISEEQFITSENNNVELFLEVNPDERSEMYSTIEEAISNHELEFDS